MNKDISYRAALVRFTYTIKSLSIDEYIEYINGLTSSIVDPKSLEILERAERELKMVEETTEIEE